MQILTNILYVIIALLMLGVIVVIHELGHFLVGRACGIGVIEFSVGMGPKLFGWQRKGIQYSLRLFPVGGYCKFVGEDDEDDAPNAMNNVSVWKRFLTVLAGPVMNFVLAFVIAVVMYAALPLTPVSMPQIEGVLEGYPAEQSGLAVGDVVTEANDTAISFDAAGIATLQSIIQESDVIDLTVDRGGEAMHIVLTPEYREEDGRKMVGVTFASVYVRDSLLGAVKDAWRMTKWASTLMLDVLRRLIFHFEGAEEVTGAIGTVALVSQSLQTDFSLIFDFIFVISLNLGIINLIPFPGLDGSRLLFLIVEAIRRKPIPPEKEGMVHAIGLVILLALAAVLAVHDVITYLL